MPPREPSENSIPFRLSVFILVSISILTASSYSSSLYDGFVSVVIMALGFLISWYRRDKNNWHIKTAMAVILLIILFRYLEELLSNPFDTRLTLANLLIYLSVLHSYDIPGRKNLAYAIFIGIILMGVSATINRDMFFMLPGILFLIVLWVVWRLDSRSAAGRPVLRSEDMVRDLSISRRVVAFTAVGVILVSLLVFVSLPHFDNRKMMQQMPVSVKISFPKDYKKGIQELPQSGGGDAKEKLKQKLDSGEAFYGFSSDMDLNYRGKLSNKIAMRVRSSQGVYWRGMAYDTYADNKWVMSKPDEVLELGSENLPINPLPQWDSPKFISAGRPLIQTFFIEEDMSNLILMASYPTEIYFPTYKVDQDIYGGYRSPIGLVGGITYTVVSVIPDYDPDRLRKAKSRIPAAHLGNYLQVPDKLKPELTMLAQSITASASNDYDRASAIESYLQLNYKYNLDVPQLPEGVDNVENFLFSSKEGYCEHFASSMVLLCRSIGIPARVVTGFSPGKRNPFTHYYEVRWSNAHAWVEVYFERYGWVPFEPTASWGEPRAAVSSDAGKSLLSGIIASMLPKNINMTFDNSPIVKFNQAVNKKLDSFNNLIFTRFVLIIAWVAVATIIITIIYFIITYISSLIARYRLSRMYPQLSGMSYDGLYRLYKLHKSLKLSTRNGLMPPEIVRIEVEKRENIRYNKKLYIFGELEEIKKLIYNE